MSIKINVSTATIPILRKAYQEQLVSIKGQIEEKEKETVSLKLNYEEISKSLKELETAVSSNMDFYNYESEWTIIEKVKYVLSKSEAPLTSREISEKLMKLEPALAEKKDSTIKNVSTILSVYQGEGKPFKRIEREKMNNLFELN